MAQTYFSAWAIYTETFAEAFQNALTDNQIDASWGVYRGPSGDAVVAESVSELDEEYAEYVEDGIVSDYLTETERDETIRALADRTGVPYDTLVKAAREGRILARRSGNAWLSTVRAVEYAIEKGTIRPRTTAGHETEGEQS